MNILQLNKYITLNGGSEMVMKSLGEILLNNGHNIFNLGFEKKNQPLLPSTISLGDEKIGVVGFFVNRSLVTKIIDFINLKDIKVIIVHNIYHHFPISQLFKEIKGSTDTKIVLYLHDYKVVCPVYTLQNNSGRCRECAGKNYYRSIRNKCKNNSYYQSILLALDSYYNSSLRDAYSYCDYMVSPSKSVKDIVTSMGVTHDINVIYNPIQQAGALSNKVIHSKSRSILYVGRLVKEKGISALLDIAIKMPDIQFDIVGDGDLEIVGRVLASSDKFSNIKYHGYQTKSQLEEHYKNAMYLIVPSNWDEVFGLVVVEAMANGTPVIGSDRGAIPELIDGTRGAIIDVNELELAIDVIQLMINKSDSEYREMAESCFKFAEKFSYQSYYKKLSKVIDI